jgi:hypothetical protein
MSGRALEEYQSLVGGVLSNVYRREGVHIVVDPTELNTPLTAVLAAEDAGSTRVEADWMPPELTEMQGMDREELLGLVLVLMSQRLQERSHMQTVFFDFLFSRGPDPLCVLENLFLYVHARNTGHLWGAKQVEIATLFGQSKQNWQHLGERLIEDLVSRWSRVEFVTSGGKNVAARLAYAKQRRGNKSRKHGRKAGDELPPLPARLHEDEPLCDQAKRRAAAMRDDAERRHLAREFGCKPEEIDLTKISLRDD